MGIINNIHNYSINNLSLFLCSIDNDIIGKLSGVTSVKATVNLSSYDGLSFVFHKTYEDSDGNIIDNALWDDLVDLATVYCSNTKTYYSIVVNLDDSEELTKNVVATSRSESELSQIYLENLEINTANDIAREDYVEPTIFYDNLNPEKSLLNRVLRDKAPHYSIGHVDNSLREIQRTFAVNNSTIYDTLMSNIATEVGCLFLFDSKDRIINAYDLENRCVDCGERIGQMTVCPNCLSSNILPGYGDDTSIFLSKNNLVEYSNLEGNADNLKNCFRVVGGDELLTATIKNITPGGSNYIYMFSDDVRRLMSEELKLVIDEYDEVYKTANENLSPLITQLYDYYDELSELESGMMPTPAPVETTAILELAKLTPARLSPTSVSNIEIASESTVNSAVLNYAKVYVYTGYKTTISSSSYNKTTHVWSGKFTVENLANPDDIATSAVDINITINDDFENFAVQKVEKILSQYEVPETEPDWSLYALSLLTIYSDAYYEALDALQQLGIGDPDNTFYDELYLVYYNRLEAINTEMSVRDAQIEAVNNSITQTQDSINNIHSTADFEKFILSKPDGEDLWKELRYFVREDTYENSNYISDGLTNAELIDKAKELILVANKELFMASRLNYTISTKLYNIFAVDEFSDFWQSFKLANWIRQKIDNVIYKFRLVSFTLDFENILESDVEFIDAAMQGTSSSSIQDLLAKTQSMATSYDSVKQQAENAFENAQYVAGWRNFGLDATQVKIVNNAVNQKVTIDNLGIIAKAYDDETEDFLPEQMRITNGTIVITDDNWRSVNTAIGRLYYLDPETGNQVEAYGINSQVLIGTLLLGEKLVISNKNNTSKIDAEGLSIENGLNQFKVSTTDINKFIQVNKKIDGEWVSQLSVDNDGNLKLSDGTIIGAGSVITTGASIDGASIDWDSVVNVGQIDATNINADTLDASVANIIKLNTSSLITQSLDAKFIDTDFINANVGSFNTFIANDGILFNLTATNVTFTDAVINDLIAKRIKTLELTAGSILTENFVIQSDTGTAGLKISGNTLQMYDSAGNVGIQLGYPEGSESPSLIIKDATGAIMLDASGLHEAIVPDKFIKTDMVGDGAVGDAQINWSTLVDKEIDGVRLFTSAEQILNSEEFTTKFTQIEEDENEIRTLVTQNQTAIGQINTTITEDLVTKDENNQIILEVRQNTSLIQQESSSIRQELTQYVTNGEFTDYQSYVADYTADEFSFVKTTLQNNYDELTGEIINNQEALTEYIRFDGNTIDIGVSNSNMQLMIDNDELNFNVGGVTKAYINVNGFSFTDGEILNRLTVGGISLFKESNGSLSML